MVSVHEALKLIDQNCSRLDSIEKKLSEASGYILAKDIISAINMPPFRQSAMDGYALHFDETVTGYKVIGEIAAGSSQKFDLKLGEAVRIFTGSAVPDSANTVVQQELVRVQNKTITLSAAFSTNKNIRDIGEQIKKGEIALQANTYLSPAAIGYLASLGFTHIPVYTQPKIALLTTGDELVEPGKNLNHGQIFESNSTMLESALSNYNYQLTNSKKTEDTLLSTTTILNELIATNDVVLISGGISVGDYDFVKVALESIGVKEIFYKVKQKPGKPFYFGVQDKKLIFALPGNPASALTCFYIYVLPALQKLSGKKFKGLKKDKGKLLNTYSKKSGLTHFLRGTLNEDGVCISEAQSSAMLNSFALANVLILIEQEIEILNAGDLTNIYLLE